MRNISSSNFIICLGDDVRYRFAQELMPEGHLINTNSLKIKKSYVFMHSDEENIITDDKKIMVYTSKLQEGRIIRSVRQPKMQISMLFCIVKKEEQDILILKNQRKL